MIYADLSPSGKSRIKQRIYKLSTEMFNSNMRNDEQRHVRGFWEQVSVRRGLCSWRQSQPRRDAE